MGLAVLTLWRAAAARADPADGIGSPRSAFWVVSVRIGIGYQLFEPYTRWQYVGRHLLYAVVGIGLVAAAVSADPGRGAVGRALGNAPMRFLGTISFGIYLWHVSVFEALKRTGAVDGLTWHPFLASVDARRSRLSSALAAASWYCAGAPAAASEVASVATGSGDRSGSGSAAAITRPARSNRHERERGQLPVPVEPGVDGPGRERRGRPLALERAARGRAPRRSARAARRARRGRARRRSRDRASGRRGRTRRGRGARSHSTRKPPVPIPCSG